MCTHDEIIGECFTSRSENMDNLVVVHECVMSDVTLDMKGGQLK